MDVRCISFSAARINLATAVEDAGFSNLEEFRPRFARGKAVSPV